MPNKFSGELIARGFAKGIGQGTAIRQSLAERLGGQKEQKSRDTQYQNFLELMQKDRQSFQNIQELRQHGLEMIRMRERVRLQAAAGDTTDSEDALSAQLRRRKSERDDAKLKLEEWETAHGVFEGRIDFLQNELKTIDEDPIYGDKTRKPFVIQQLRRAMEQLNTWLIDNPPPGRPDVSRTIREENEEFKRKQQEEIEKANFFMSRPYPVQPSKYGNESYNKRYGIGGDVTDERTNNWLQFEE